MRLGSMIGELHRRSVWKVLGSYAVLAWVSLQLADFIGGRFGFPHWFGPGTVVVVLLGFPVLLVTTLIQGGPGKGDYQSRFHDSADGGDDSLSSWQSLGTHPVQDALGRVFTWRNAIAGGVLTALLLGIAAIL